MRTLEYQFIHARNGDGKLPVYQAKGSNIDLKSFYLSNKEEILEILTFYGGILLKGFDVVSLSEFNELASIVSPKLSEYTYRSTPRSHLGGHVYTATDYPPDRSIPFHNECSYSLDWPEKILFFCVIPAEEGGETPIADSRAVYQKIPVSIKEQFEKHHVMYVRNYLRGVDLSWQDVFQTDKKEEVERYCQEQSITYEWKNGTVELTTRQICQAIHVHPMSQKKVWFNQAHLFHCSSLDKEDLMRLEVLLGSQNLPRNAFYGNGDELDSSSLDQIRAIYDQERIEFKWEKRDVLILDNVLMAHSRNPFKGNRKIVVAMGE